MKKFILSFLIVTMFSMPSFASEKFWEVEFYRKQYISDGTNIPLLINRTGPSLKTAYGMDWMFELPLKVFTFGGVELPASVHGIGDPPEEFLLNLGFERNITCHWLTSIEHSRRHNVSRSDIGSEKGFGDVATFVMLSYTLGSEFKEGC